MKVILQPAIAITIAPDDFMVDAAKFFRAFVVLLGAAGYVLATLAGMFALLTAALAFFERHQPMSVWDAIYLSAITALTVGYGDVVPKTVGGRVSAVCLALLGVLFIGIVVAAAIKALEDAAKP